MYELVVQAVYVRAFTDIEFDVSGAVPGERLVGRLHTRKCMVVEDHANICLLEHFHTALLRRT